MNLDGTILLLTNCAQSPNYHTCMGGTLSSVLKLPFRSGALMEASSMLCSHTCMQLSEIADALSDGGVDTPQFSSF